MPPGASPPGARMVLLGLMAGSRKDHETVSSFFRDMKNRNLDQPLLMVSDGTSGVIKAIARDPAEKLGTESVRLLPRAAA